MRSSNSSSNDQHEIISLHDLVNCAKDHGNTSSTEPVQKQEQVQRIALKAQNSTRIRNRTIKEWRTGQNAITGSDGEQDVYLTHRIAVNHIEEAKPVKKVPKYVRTKRC